MTMNDGCAQKQHIGNKQAPDSKFDRLQDNLCYV